MCATLEWRLVGPAMTDTFGSAPLLTMPRVAAPRRAGIRASALTGGVMLCIVLAASAAGMVLGLRVAVLALTIVAFAALVAGFWSPRLGLFGIGMLCTLDPMMSWLVFTGGGVLRWNTLNYVLLVGTIVWAPLLLRRSDVPFRLLTACVVLLATEVLLSADRARGMQDVLAMSAMFGVAVYCVRAEARKADWYWMGLICGTIAAAGGFLFFRQQAVLPDINPNAWSYVPVTGLFSICLALPCARDRSHGPLVLAGLAAINLAWTFLSGSRGSMLVALACTLYLFLELRRPGRQLTVAAIVTTGFLILATQFTDLQRHAIGRVEALLNPHAAMADRTSRRSEMLRGGIMIFRSHPLGVGTGGFTPAWRLLGPRGGLVPSGQFRNMQAHSGWVKVLAENGVPGAALLGSFVASFAIMGMRRRHRGMRMLGLLATLALALGMVSSEYQNKGLWFLAAAVTVMLGRRSPLWQ